MKKILFILLIVGCKGGVHQEILLLNKSNSSIHCILYSDTTLNISEIESLRPETDITIKEHFKSLANYSKNDSLEIVESLKTKGTIKPNTSKIILASSYVGIFRNKESIKSLIKNHYNGKVHIFILKSEYLNNYSNKEIIEKKLYKQFVTLTEKDIIKDTLIFEYKN